MDIHGSKPPALIINIKGSLDVQDLISLHRTAPHLTSPHLTSHHSTLPHLNPPRPANTAGSERAFYTHIHPTAQWHPLQPVKLEALCGDVCPSLQKTLYQDTVLRAWGLQRDQNGNALLPLSPHPF